MCEECHNEADSDYSGDSIEEKRNKSARSVIERHPELGLKPEEVTVQFAPKAEEGCVHASDVDGRPHFEIHIPSYMAQAMSDTPPLRQIAIAAWIQTNKSYEELSECLSLQSQTRYDGLFVSEAPPIRASQVEQANRVIEYEESLREK